MGNADLHIHSTYSHDATSTVRAVLKQAADTGLNVIAVTDHDEIRGSLEAQELASKYGIESIPAVEVSTKEGHLVALFVKTLPPVGLTLVDTLIHIGRLGGVAIVPHPFNNLPSSLSMEAVVSALTNPRAFESATADVGAITGQKPVANRAKRSIANFKVRQGNPVGLSVTMRGDRMWEFYDRLVNAALPRIRDFHGVSNKAFDGRGNYSLGLQEQLMVPEIEYDKIDRVRSLQIVIVTTARNDEHGKRLLQLLGMPFSHN